MSFACKNIKGERGAHVGLPNGEARLDFVLPCAGAAGWEGIMAARRCCHRREVPRLGCRGEDQHPERGEVLGVLSEKRKSRSAMKKRLPRYSAMGKLGRPRKGGGLGLTWGFGGGCVFGEEEIRVRVN